MSGNNIYKRKFVILEKRFTPKVQTLIKKQISSFISDYRSLGKNEALSRLQLSVNTDFYSLLAELYKAAGLMGARLTYSELTQSLASGKKAGAMGRGWILALQEFLQENGLELVNDINETTKNRILRILERGVRDQLSFDEITKELQKPEISAARARRIARTEIVRASNVGHQIGAKAFPYEVMKIWSAADDHRTRHSHRQADGKRLDENEFFKIRIYEGDKLEGEEEMIAPGDPKASASNTINCRCRLKHEPKLDKKGKPIPRSANTAQIIPMRSTSLLDNNLRDAIAASLKMQVD